MATSAPTSLMFKVQRHEPELITPAEPTPHELKLLSNIDDQEHFRVLVPGVLIYRHNPSMEGKDPVEVVREALSKALVFYYPFAGRIRQGPGRKLMVACTAEGVLFIEADADVTVEQFGDPLIPPIPCLKELLYNVPGSDGILNCPLLLIQVTRLRCGGFIVGFRGNHALCDAQGMGQFLSAVGEIARGAYAPSVLPVWERHLLGARDPPHVTREHREYDEVPSNNIVLPHQIMCSSEISAIRKLVLVPLGLYYTNFDLVAACAWRLRTVALQLDPDEETRLICPVNVRGKLETPLPPGYYGNAFAIPAAITTVRELCENSLDFAVQKVRKLKTRVDGEYMKSLADLRVLKG
ncbi:Benzyl alcohol O-benzoyltransferase [Tripterygium wilfordii]|uniref:Benzyl alcohol O-benzoyltransferase n=1 Tax=Tripterygium wilfordii TaxID=458696 RepID=A0A7J7CMM3_TRIWF|nr:Benzyl alcohol O-benzoyltransferase [Tripterygium wilfordii]